MISSHEQYQWSDVFLFDRVATVACFNIEQVERVVESADEGRGYGGCRRRFELPGLSLREAQDEIRTRKPYSYG